MSKAGMYSFGIPHKYYKKVYIPETGSKPDETLPGPGTYDDNYRTLGS